MKLHVYCSKQIYSQNAQKAQVEATVGGFPPPAATSPSSLPGRTQLKEETCNHKQWVTLKTKGLVQKNSTWLIQLGEELHWVGLRYCRCSVSQRGSSVHQGGLLEGDEDRAHAGDVFGLLAGLRVKVTQPGHPFPLSAWGWLVNVIYKGFFCCPGINNKICWFNVEPCELPGGCLILEATASSCLT